MSKERLDRLLVERGFAPDEKGARSLVMTGDVLVENVPVTSPGKKIDRESDLRLRGEECCYVSRGGIKLEAALKHFHLKVKGKIAVDVGASTGGFTDCLLQHGATKVYAIDVGYGQFDYKLRQDPRVTLFERTHIRDVTPDFFSEPIDIVVVDLSFIATASILSFIDRFLHAGSFVVILVKPQFELPKTMVEMGGVVHDSKKREKALADVVAQAKRLTWKNMGSIPSPITGAKGNIEYVALFQKEESTCEDTGGM